MATINKTNTLPVGHQLKEYRIQSIFKESFFDITYLAYNDKINKQVIIKEYFPNNLATRKNNYYIQPKSSQEKDNFFWGLKKFLEEGKLLSDIQHPNIIKVLTYFNMHNTAYIVMDYEQGKSLSAILSENNSISETKLMALLPPLLSGLRTIHEAGLFHQNIQLDNIYLRNTDYQPILLDFGISSYALAQHCHYTAGISKYAPIEQYQFKNNQGPWTDIYALGAVLYHIISGQMPNKVATRVQTIKLKKKDLTPAIKIGQHNYSQDLLNGIDWAMRISPKKRPQSIQEWLEVLLPKFPSNKFDAKQNTDMKSEINTNYFAKSGKKSVLLIPKAWILISILTIVMLNGTYIFYTEQHFKYLHKQHVTELEQSKKLLQQEQQKIITHQSASETQLETIEEQLEMNTYTEKQKNQQFKQLKVENSLLKQTIQKMLQQYTRQTMQAKKLTIVLGSAFRDRLKNGNLGSEMIWLPGKKFQMGDIYGTGKQDEQPVHWVSIDDFAIGRYEVTFSEYEQFVKATGRKTFYPANWQANYPVTHVSWQDAVAYTKWLSQQTGEYYRLPTEAEWEYVARANTVHPFLEEDKQYEMLAVGSSTANFLGLYDIMGNVREWTCSLYASRYNGSEQRCVDYVTENSHLVERGGSWVNHPSNIKISTRQKSLASKRYNNVGFRLVRLR